ncbi:MAG: hypothetical protein ACLTSX_09425 [Collinsella sp.]
MGAAMEGLRAQARTPQQQEDGAHHLRRDARAQAEGRGHGRAGLHNGERPHRQAARRRGREEDEVNESDTRLKLIDPALKKSWDSDKQIFTEYYFTAGEIVVRGHFTTRKKPKKADYLLMYAPELPLAVVEAKDTEHTVGAGLQQAMGYAEALDIPFAYSIERQGLHRARLHHG